MNLNEYNISNITSSLLKLKVFIANIAIKLKRFGVNFKSTKYEFKKSFLQAFKFKYFFLGIISILL